MTPTRVVLVGGTWSWGGWKTRGQWYQADSPFVAFLEANGCEIVGKFRPFVWTSRVNGLIFQRNRHLDWDTAGANLSLYLDPAVEYVGVRDVPVDCVITHSHGLQVAAYACAYHGASIPRLVDVSGPIRHDMERTYNAARAKIGRWAHAYCPRTDWMQLFGEVFDGKLWPCRRAPLADLNVGIPQVGHSGLVRDAQHFPRWTEVGLMEVIHGQW